MYKNIKNISCIIIICIMSASSCFATLKLYEAKTVKQINDTMLSILKDQNPQKAAFVFSIENLLLELKTDTAPKEIDKELRGVLKKLAKKIKLSRNPYIKEVILTEFESKLKDEFAVEFIKNLQDLKIPMIATTRNVSGSLNDIDRLEVWTHDLLKEKGVDLSNSPIGDREIVFNKFYKKANGSYPVLYKGVLAMNTRNSKHSMSSLISTLLATKLHWKPAVVYIVDSNASRIQFFAKALEAIRSDIQVFGFIYKLEKNKEIDKKEFLKVVNSLVEKVNNVKRKEINKNTEDPYEQ